MCETMFVIAYHSLKESTRKGKFRVFCVFLCLVFEGGKYNVCEQCSFLLAYYLFKSSRSQRNKKRKKMIFIYVMLLRF